MVAAKAPKTRAAQEFVKSSGLRNSKNKYAKKRH
jgi:hypothetical protein